MVPDDVLPPSNRPKERESILGELIETGLREHERPGASLFLSALTAGLEVGFSVLLMSVLYTQYVDEVSAGALRAIIAAAYPLGFLLVVIGRSELFTEHTNVAMLPALDGRVRWISVLRVWSIVLVGNLIGGWVFAGAVLVVVPAMGSADIEAFVWIAEHMAEADLLAIFGSAVFAGWLMGLLSWMVAASQETLSRMTMVILVTGIIGLVGLHHSIVGNIELAAALFVDGISLRRAVSVELIAIAGNLVGGAVLVSLIKYAHASADG